MNYLIKTHRPGMTYKGSHVFVLNRGRNSGKPLELPCPNCWVIQTQSEEDATRLRQILYAMQRSRRFDPYLRGSVIDFIPIKEFKRLLRDAIELASLNPKFDSVVRAIQAADVMEQTILNQMVILKELRFTLGAKLLQGV
jgi:hypothetical protein